MTPLVLQGETNLGKLGINTLQSRYAKTSSSPECECNGTCTYLLPFNTASGGNMWKSTNTGRMLILLVGFNT
ncbi:hypothetical protein Q2T42_03255 [Leptolyngbya boryana CZ1]|uniref:Uncharacterized protein n=1 Tax=Leptolyngbya boryana CZ1 TaxID=3060204 RepID=A0AA97AX01_LEPBY|nr:hypothetical protein [Leptolyngbya boryana]WNZ46856.1 hypothetical protein Q2T42_03255 [Leptolyngbya boryana CZ1]